MAEILNIKPSEQVEDPTHAEEMIAKAEGKQPQQEEGSQEEPTQEGKLYADKYKTEEELQKGTLELLKKRGNLEEFYKTLEAEVLNPSKKETEDVKEEATESLEKQVEDLEEQKQKSKVDFTPYEQEFFEKGELSEESYKTLEEQGFDKQLVDRYIEGVQAVAEKQAQEVFNTVGGEDKYNEMIAWAGDNLTEKEKQIFNSQIQSVDIDQTKFAVEALYGKYMRANRDKPTPIQGKTPSASGGERFNSRQEVVEAMSNPKYETDPAYRAMVERKLAHSDVF